MDSTAATVVQLAQLMLHQHEQHCVFCVGNDVVTCYVLQNENTKRKEVRKSIKC